MKRAATRAFAFVAIAAVILAAAYSRSSAGLSSKSVADRIASVAPATETAAQAEDRVRFFESRLARYPTDIDVLNSLSSLYLQRLRETGSFGDLDLALRASRRSLAVVPAIHNPAGLAARALAEFASHEFVSARDDARALSHIDGSGTPYAVLGDTEAELGHYRAAEDAYRRLARMVGRADENVETRRARMALIDGDNVTAEAAFGDALSLELARTDPSRERVAWFCWQLGDTAFFTGDYSHARADYDDALDVYPHYFRALASSGRLAAAQGDLRRATGDYQAAVRALPDPTFVAELGDVYTVRGDRAAAERQYALVDFIGRLSAINGVMYNRQLVMFDADHGRNVLWALRSARREYRTRRDILGADAVAWSALAAGAIPQARAAMRDALRMGTRDPRLFYHAGMIARAAGDREAARTYLSEALALCPAFDPLQAPIARAALVSVGGPVALNSR